MVSVLRFTVDPIDLQEEIKRRDDYAESIRRELFVAARKIQAWIRGILTRKHLRLLQRSTITIQRHWRGYYARVFADRYLVERVHRMWQDYYDRMATRIQADWRGYWVRKTILDIPKMRRWLETVYKKNEEAVENMNRFRRNEIKSRERSLELESMQWVLFILFKLHHLLRTKQQPGVVTRIDETSFTFVEDMLKCFEYRKYTGRDVVCCHDCDIDPKRSSIFRGTHYERCEKAIRKIEDDLRSGAVPVFRSFSYEKQERLLREENRRRKEASLHRQCETGFPYEKQERLLREENRRRKEASLHRHCRAGSQTTTRVGETRKRESQRKEESGLSDYCEITELYEKIKNMDCQLDRFLIKCPVHNVLLAGRTTV